MFDFLPWLDTSGLLIPLSIVGLYLAIIVIVAEGINRLTPTDVELTRKIVHIGSGNVILFAWLLNISAWVAIAASFIAAIIALLSYFIPILPSINSVGRQSLGTFFYAISIGILVALFWPIGLPQYAVLGILIMTWGDGLAAVIGIQFGKHRYQILGSTKSWEGSLTMTLVSYIITSLILLTLIGNIWQTWAIALIVAVASTALESFSKLGIDNLTVPLGSAAIAFFLTQLLPI